jgi:hypothetical protein
MHRQRFGYAAVFGWSPTGHEQGAALNHPSQPRGRALGHEVASAGPPVRGLEKTRVATASGGLRVFMHQKASLALAAGLTGRTILVARIEGVDLATARQQAKITVCGCSP